MSCPSTATVYVYGATEDVLLGDELAELVPGAAHIILGAGYRSRANFRRPQ